MDGLPGQCNRASVIVQVCVLYAAFASAPSGACWFLGAVIRGARMKRPGISGGTGGASHLPISTHPCSDISLQSPLCVFLPPADVPKHMWASRACFMHCFWSYFDLRALSLDFSSSRGNIYQARRLVLRRARCGIACSSTVLSLTDTGCCTKLLSRVPKVGAIWVCFYCVFYNLDYQGIAFPSE